MSDNVWYPPVVPMPFEPDEPSIFRIHDDETETPPTDEQIAAWDAALPPPPLLAHEDQ